MNAQDRAQAVLAHRNAVVPPEFWCGHLGDSRYCAQCVGDELEAERIERKREKRETRQIRAHEDTIKRQGDALAAQSAEIERLRRIETGLRSQLARKGRRWR